MEKITGSEALLRALIAEGVDTIFGYPGGAVIPVYDCLYDYKDKLKHVLVRHEQGATHAAQGYARVSGKVGVALVTSGPGATNTLTGIADAMMDSTPLVVITGQVASSLLGTDAFQEIDVIGITQPITKWAFQIRRPEDIAWAVSRAFYIASTGRPGPVVLDFAKDAQVGMVEYAYKKVDYIRSYQPEPDIVPERIQLAADLINKAERPFCLVGQGVILGNAERELMAFLTRNDIPAASTTLGLSAMPSDFPLNKGMLGMHGNLAPNVKTNECDVLIAIGMRFSDRDTGVVSTYAKQAKIIHLDIDRAEINKNVVCDVPVVGDCKMSLPAITRLLNKNSHREWIDSFAEYAKMENEKVIQPDIHPKDGPLLMGEVANIVSEALNGNGVLVTDVGQNQMISSRYFKYLKKRSIVTSGGFGTMGFGLPAAIGATFGDHDRTICCFMGDGGFQMSIQELGTIMEQQAPVKMILLNNNYLGNVRQWQDLMYEGRHSFTDMLNPRYEYIAKAYGIPYDVAINREDLERKVKKMLDTKGPYLLECAIKPEEDIVPMILPGSSVNEMLLELEY